MSSSSDDDNDEDLAEQLRGLKTSDAIQDKDNEQSGSRLRRIGSTRRKTPRPRYPRHQPEAVRLLQQITGKSFAGLTSVLYKTYLVPTRNKEYKDILKYVRNSQNHGFGIEVINIIRIVRNKEFEFSSRSTNARHHYPRSKPRPPQQPTPASSSSAIPQLFSQAITPSHNNGSNTQTQPVQGTISSNNPFRMIVWHGTKKQHVASILMNGFAIPPKTTQMFGTGIYFADRASKSSQYCDSNTPGSEGYLFLCDVHLGTMFKAKNAHAGFQVAPPGFDSVKCCGERRPDWANNTTMKGATLPFGRTIDSTRFDDYTLIFNEYIAYETEKVRAKFLVVVKFHSKKIN